MGHIAHRGNLGAMLLPKEIFRDPRLVGNERLLLCTLFEFTDNEKGTCHISGATIEELSGIAARNVKTTSDTLVKKGWLTVIGGSTKKENHYTITIPVEDETWNYTFATDKKLTSEGWAKKQEANERKKAEDMLQARIKRNDWGFFSPDQLAKELDEELALGKQWVPDSALENFGMVRGADNSEEGREERRAPAAAASKGVVDPFEECGAPAPPAVTTGKFAGMSKDQLLDYGFKNGAESIDEATLRSAGLSRSVFPE